MTYAPHKPFLAALAESLAITLISLPNYLHQIKLI
jgi:hypothetical protein